jgi:hypothetical protein
MTPGVGVCAALMFMAVAAAQNRPLVEYADPSGRFQFSYPASFGTPAPGTNDGFADRVAAIRFARFTAAGIGGEAALTQGRPMLDMQAAGGLHDAIALEIFPDALRQRILQSVPPLTRASFCDQIAREQHIDPGVPGLAGLTSQQRAAVTSVDRMRNITPRVITCRAEQETIVFDKEVSFQEGGSRQHVYGAVRFLPAPYSTFQLIQAGPAPDTVRLEEIAGLVRSFSLR